MPARVTKEQLTRLATARLASLGGMPQGVVGAPGSLKSLRLEMLRMVCVDETNGFLGNEWGSDEIALGGVTLDETAKVGKVGPFDLGEFDDNTRKDYLSAPKVLFTFDLSKAKTFPNSFFVTLVLVEEDFGDFSETVNDIIHKLEGETAEYLAALIGSEVGTAGGPLGTLVGLFVGWAVGKIVNSLISAWKDDPFTPQTIEVIIPSADANFGGDLTKPSEVIHFTGPGQYAMRYRWALTKVPRPVVTA
jgi:tetrahydromethanopterin S-methyltransferase subunit G